MSSIMKGIVDEFEHPVTAAMGAMDKATSSVANTASNAVDKVMYEDENVAVIYIDGKPAAKYARKHEAERDAEFMRERFPNKKIEIKHEVREEVVLDENLHKWFKEKWVRFGPDGKIRGSCARGDDSEGKPKCLPQKKAHALGKKGRKYAASKKRREDPNPERSGKAINVATKKKTNEEQLDEKCWDGYKQVGMKKKGDRMVPNCVQKEDVHEEKCPECGGPMYHESMMNEKQDACYHKVRSRYKVWPSAYASGALVQCRKKGAKNWGTGGKKNESSIMKGLVDEAGSPAQQAAIAISMKKKHKKPKNEGIFDRNVPLEKRIKKMSDDELGALLTKLEREQEPSIRQKYGHGAWMGQGNKDIGAIRTELMNRKMAAKKTNEGVIVGHDKDDPEVAVLGGAGTMSLSRLKKKAHAEAMQLADDIANGKYNASSYNMKQLHNTLNTIVAAEKEMEKLYFGEDYTGEFAAEKTPAINPYGGLKDRKFRGAISEGIDLAEAPDTSGAVGVQPGGWRRTDKPNVEEGQIYSTGGGPGESQRKFKPKSAGTFKKSSEMKGKTGQK